MVGCIVVGVFQMGLQNGVGWVRGLEQGLQ